MKAIVRTKPGKQLSTMQVQDLPSAPLQPDELRIKMSSARINPVDVDLMKGMPFLKYKKPQIGGIDGAGEVLEAGNATSGFQKGDVVWFYRLFTDIGTWAEEITIKASDVAKVPTNLSTQDAGAIALPVLTAWDSLAQLNAKPGDSILIHGGGGGVGFQAVQLAVQRGLKVYTTASERDFELLKTAGVHAVLNYKTQQFDQELAQGSITHIFDTVGGDVLKRSIGMQPANVVSVHYADTAKMHKTGIQFPGFLNWIMKLAMGKHVKAAKKAGVNLIGQVTGANGAMLQEASNTIATMDYRVKPYNSIPLADVAKNGLSGSDVGSVILLG